MRTPEEDVAVAEINKGLATERLTILLTRESAKALLRMADPPPDELRGLDALKDAIERLMRVAGEQSMVLHIGGTYIYPESPTPEQEKRIALMDAIGWLEYQYELFKDGRL
jgi:hypothetical protein